MWESDIRDRAIAKNCLKRFSSVVYVEGRSSGSNGVKASLHGFSGSDIAT